MWHNERKKFEEYKSKELVARVNKLDAGWPGVIDLRIVSQGPGLLGVMSTMSSIVRLGLGHGIYWKSN